ncbi:MAG: hypothetical protein ACLGH0_04770, partial [Thermoanaerobaculia bacterium]
FVFSIGIVLGWPVITEGFHAIAGLAPTMRMRMAICFFASLLIAYVVDHKESRLPLLLGTATVTFAMLWLLRNTDFPSPSHRITAILAFLPSVAVLAAVTLPRIGLALAGIATVFELFFAIAWWHPILPSRELYPRTPLIAALEREPGPFRILGTGGQLYPNVGAMFGLEDVRVHDPMADARYVQLLTQVVGWDPKDYYAKWNDTATPLIDYLNVRYVVTRGELPAPRYELLYAGRDGRVYRNHHALPRFFAVRNVLVSDDLRTHTDWRYTAVISRLPKRFAQTLTAPWTAEDATVQILEAGIDRYKLRVQAPRTTLVVSSIPLWPGWRANDFPLLEVNGGFLGFVVPAGEHEIDVRYRPLSFWIPAFIAAATALALCGMLLWDRRRAAPARAAPPLPRAA